MAFREIEVSQRWALPQDCCKTFCPCNAEFILAEIEVRRRWALPHKLSCIFSSDFTEIFKITWKGTGHLECGDEAGCHRCQLPENEL